MFERREGSRGVERGRDGSRGESYRLDVKVVDRPIW